MLTASELVEALVRTGVPREKAEAYAKGQGQQSSSLSSSAAESPNEEGSRGAPGAPGASRSGAGAGAGAAAARTPAVALPLAVLQLPVELPFRLTVPWSQLCSDNEHEVAYLRMVGGKPYPARKMTARYRAAKEAIHAKARAVVGDARARTEPLAILVNVYVPSAQHSNDHINFSKVVHDALQHVVYVNDRQLHDVHWVRAGIDVDAPRAEIVIRALLPTGL